MSKGVDIRSVVRDIIEQTLNESASDSIVDDVSDGILLSLTNVINDEDDLVLSNAWEYMMGSMPDEERMALGRYEDVESTAELVVQKILKDPGLHDALHNVAATMLRSTIGLTQGD
jgi:hypothetical protein